MYMQCSAVSKAAKPTLHAASLVADRHVMFWFARWRLLSACVVYNTHQNGNSENRRREFQHRQDAFSVKIQNIHMSIRIQVADHFGGPGNVFLFVRSLPISQSLAKPGGLNYRFRGISCTCAANNIITGRSGSVALKSFDELFTSGVATKKRRQI